MNAIKKTPSEGLLYVSFMLFVFPLFVFTDYSNITDMKMIAYLVLLAGFAAMAAVTVLEDCKKAKRQGISKPKWKWNATYLPDVCILLFLLSGTVSWLASPYFGQKNADGLELGLFGAGRFDGMLFFASYALIYFLTSRYGEVRSYHIKGFCFVMLAMCGITVVQLAGVNALHLYPAALYKGFYNEFVSTIGNVNMMGGFLCMTVPLIGVGYVVFRLNRWFSALFLLVHTLSVYVMLSIGVDMTVVGLAALVAVMAPLLLRNRRYALKTLEIAMTIVLGWGLSTVVSYTYLPLEERTVTAIAFGKPFWISILLVAVLAGVWWILGSRAWKGIRWRRVRFMVVGLEVLALIAGFCFFRFVYEPTAFRGLARDLYELTRGQLSLTAGHNRIGIWTYSLQMAKDHLWLGTGSGTFAATFKEMAAKVGYSRYMHRNLDFAHNEYIHILCTMGLSGLFCYLGILCTSAWNALKLLDKNPKLLMLGAAVFGYSVWVFFCFSMVIVTPLFWMLLGLLMREVRMTLYPPVEPQEPISTPCTACEESCDREG